MSAVPINQLARPKSTKYECEICGKAATLKCSECPTFYCTQEHFDIDWRGIRHLIAQDIVVLRERPKMIGSEEERDRRTEELMGIRKELLELCTETAQKHLVQGKYELAVPGALQSLKFAIEVFGSEATELVPSYLLLAEANLGLRRLKIAEEFLSLANWNILKHPEAGSSMMSNLQRNFGRLYAAQQRYNEALQAFATDIYHSSHEFGPENIRSAPSYFHMGRVFQSHQKSDRASAFYTKVVEVYTSFLETWLSETGGEGSSDITAVEVEEAMEIVKHITEYREKRCEDDSSDQLRMETAEGRYTLGLLLMYTGEVASSRDCLSQALEVFLAVAGLDHKKTLACQKHLETLDKRVGTLAPEG
uniref:MYND-type domain-containing protein n=1 Tax=Alexandrium monilatum TaxID=311494 RepID=A0A7S4PS91_9DINO